MRKQIDDKNEENNAIKKINMTAMNLSGIQFVTNFRSNQLNFSAHVPLPNIQQFEYFVLNG